MDILCIGLMVCDIIIKPVNNKVFDVDSTRIDSLKIASGGDAFNAAINMAKLGLDVGLVGKVGNDALGKYLVSEAEKSGIYSVGILKSDQMSTSTSIVMVEDSGERHFIYYGEANDSLCINDIDLNLLKNTKIVHLGSAMALNRLDGSGIAELFKKAKEAGAITSMDVTSDTSGKWIEKIDEALYYTDIFMPSLHEAQMISQKENPEEMKMFFSKYGLKILAVKMGNQGCFVTDFKERFTIKTFEKTKVIDTTGAGDAFVSGFLAGTIRQFNIYDRGILGNAVASNCVTRIGATAGTGTWDETMKYIKENLDNSPEHKDYIDAMKITIASPEVAL
jgi:sugar/nucleoside kinase (ribokinase family)